MYTWCALRNSHHTNLDSSSNRCEQLWMWNFGAKSLSSKGRDIRCFAWTQPGIHGDWDKSIYWSLFCNNDIHDYYTYDQMFWKESIKLIYKLENKYLFNVHLVRQTSFTFSRWMTLPNLSKTGDIPFKRFSFSKYSSYMNTYLL